MSRPQVPNSEERMRTVASSSAMIMITRETRVSTAPPMSMYRLTRRASSPRVSDCAAASVAVPVLPTVVSLPKVSSGPVLLVMESPLSVRCQEMSSATVPMNDL